MNLHAAMNLHEIVARALAEDVGAGDATTAATVPEAATARGLVRQKAAGVVFGFDAAEEAFRQAVLRIRRPVPGWKQALEEGVHHAAELRSGPGGVPQQLQLGAAGGGEAPRVRP